MDGFNGESFVENYCSAQRKDKIEETKKAIASGKNLPQDGNKYSSFLLDILIGFCCGIISFLLKEIIEFFFRIRCDLFFKALFAFRIEKSFNLFVSIISFFTKVMVSSNR